ncbi:MAG: hypothetical protein IKB33_01850 [Spirochaetaceae bacterium]|nr:hypothetical protein [Spirochaetaceae bacterium]
MQKNCHREVGKSTVFLGGVTHLEFDLDLAIEESSKNPVFYVQYAHARICRIIEKMKEEEGITLNSTKASDISFSEPAELAIIRHLALLPSEITDAAKSYNPSVVTRYVQELAQLFHKFYDTCKIKGEEASVINSRLALCEAVKTVIKNMLDLLKVEAPEKM